MATDNELDLEHNCDCIYCCPNGHCECEDCAEPCPQDCLDELNEFAGEFND